MDGRVVHHLKITFLNHKILLPLTFSLWRKSSFCWIAPLSFFLLDFPLSFSRRFHTFCTASLPWTNVVAAREQQRYCRVKHSQLCRLSLSVPVSLQALKEPQKMFKKRSWKSCWISRKYSFCFVWKLLVRPFQRLVLLVSLSRPYAMNWNTLVCISVHDIYGYGLLSHKYSVVEAWLRFDIIKLEFQFSL